MEIRVSQGQVLTNIKALQNAVFDKEKREGEKEQRKRIYHLLVNQHTGEMRFAQKISRLEHHLPRYGGSGVEGWKWANLVVTQQFPKMTVQFELRDAEERKKLSGLDQLATKVVQETLEVLNIKGKEVHSLETLPEEAVLQDLSSSVRLASPEEKIENLPGWTPAKNRREAEKMLFHQPVGTYLLREGDPMTLSISFHFSEELYAPVHPYLLTVVEESEKISDYLLLETSEGWIHYTGWPDLKDPSHYKHYPTPRALLNSIQEIASHPLGL